MTTRLAVPEMSCSGCETAIRAALAPVAGVDAVEVDLANKTVDVLHDAPVDRRRLVQAVEGVGYEVIVREELN
jgi:copper chaperone CopZ